MPTMWALAEAESPAVPMASDGDSDFPGALVGARRAIGMEA